MQNSKKNKFVTHSIVSLAAISIFLANISQSGLWYPDAPAHALNGVFYLDMIEEGGFLDVKRYVERYYVQYPTLTVGLYPPIFYIIEALVFKIFGVSTLVAKFAVLLFTLIGANVFLLLCKLWFPTWLSVIGCILFLLQPGTLFGQKNVMLEMPALSMTIVALYCLYVATEKRSSWALFFAPLLMALAFLTKQTAIFLILVFAIWVTWRRAWNMVKSGHFVSGVLVGTVILIPWIFINLTVGRVSVVNFFHHKYDVWSNCLYYARHSDEIVSYPIMCLFGLSLIFFRKLKNNDGYRFGLIWACCSLFPLAFFGLCAPYYATFVIPSLIIPSMQLVWFFKERWSALFRHKAACLIVVGILIGAHLQPQAVWGGYDMQGFEQVADHVVKDRDCMAVLYSGHFHSNFILQMRVRDKDRRVFIFRANKIVFSTKVFLKRGYHELVKDISEFYGILDRYSIKYIVQEEKDCWQTPADKRLRQWIKEPKFRVQQEYPMRFRNMEGFGNVLVYEYLDYKAKPIQRIELDMPALGRKITVNVHQESRRRSLSMKVE